MAGYTKVDMLAMFRKGYICGSMNPEVPDDTAPEAEMALRAVQVDKASKPKRSEDAVLKAWNDADQPEDGIVIDGFRHVPLQFGRKSEK